MEQAIEHGGDGGAVAEQFAPVFDGAVGSQQGAGALVAAHDDLQQILGGGGRELAHAEVVDDEQRHGGQQFHVLFARAVEGGFGDFLEQGVGLAVEDAIALLDGGLADGLGEMAFAGAGRAEKQRVFAAGDEGGRWPDRRPDCDSSSC